MTAAITAMILAIAAEVGIPLYFALAVALTENPALDPLAVNVNQNGTYDRGVMQLNSSWFNGDWQDPETNIRAGCNLLKTLSAIPELNTWWDVALCYNAGTHWFAKSKKPPDMSIEYACKVMARWETLERYPQVVVRK
jgi:soluble lytic murein transglycosylase-like protein